MTAADKLGYARMTRAKAVRGKAVGEQVRHYIRRAGAQTFFVCLAAVLLGFVDVVQSAVYDPAVAYANKRMEFNTSTVFEDLSPAGRAAVNDSLFHTNFETGVELDQSNPNYDERRWTFSWGVDMILRFEKGYTFCDAYVAVPAENAWPVEVRAFLYLFCLFYLFLGVAIISDIFMGAIEEITAEKQKIVIQEGDGGEKQEVVVTYTIWNDTVANLTLLALGSSAPEILLAVVETITTLDKVPGELGPSTIVGSAAFNLLCITGICMLAVEEVKKVKEFGVFLITCGTSIFAYVWMIIVLQVSSPDIIEIWEGVVTLLFFPAMVIVSWLQDRNWFRPEAEEEEGAGEEEMQRKGDAGSSMADTDDAEKNEVTVALAASSGNNLAAPSNNAARRSTTAKILDAQLVGCSEEEVFQIINATKLNHGRVTEDTIREELQKSRPAPKLNAGHYRMSVIRKMIMKQNDVLKRMRSSVSMGSSKRVAPAQRAEACPESGIVEFSSPSYSVLEGEGELWLRAVRTGGHKGVLKVKYGTADLTAIDGVHYHSKEGFVVFNSGDVLDKEFKIPIIDNDVPNPDMLFVCKLETVQEAGVASHVGSTNLAVITIIDDDLPGEILFKRSFVTVSESKDSVRIEVVREGGVTGALLASFKTSDGTGKNAALAGRDYVATSGHIHYAQGESQKFIEVKIMDRSQMDRQDHFFVTLSSVEGKAGGKIGRLSRIKVIITPDNAMVDLVQDVMNKVKEQEGSENTWANQIREAMEIGDDEDGRPPSFLDYLMHFLTFFWKVLFAFVPPPSYGGGFPCFCVSLFCIGLVTAMVAEIANLLGCSMGLKAQVTAITFVALGTSLPDTFASKQAIENEEYADAAVGNVTGSNSVNVFLGLGLPWVLASIYYEAKGECYIVPSGTLSFSVTVFSIVAAVCIMILLVLRAVQGGEIGGKFRWPIAIFFFFLWFLYILFSSLNAYGHLPQFPGTENRCPCQCSNRGILTWAKEAADVQGSCLAAGCPV